MRRVQQRETNWAGNHVYRAAASWCARQTIEELLRRRRASSSRSGRSGRGTPSPTWPTPPGRWSRCADLPAEVEIDTASGAVRVVRGSHLRAPGDGAAPSRAGPWAGWRRCRTSPWQVRWPPAPTAPGDGVGSLSSCGQRRRADRRRRRVRTSRRGEPDFDGHVVSLGALGVVTHLTLDIEPTFEVRQDVHLGLGWEDLRRPGRRDPGCALQRQRLHRLGTRGAHPGVGEVAVPAADAAFADRVRRARLRGPHPAGAPRHMLAGRPEEALTPQLGETGPWHERLPHFRMEFTPSRGAELQSEYFVPRVRAAAVGAALRGIGGELAHLLQVSEIRTIAADHLWLSGSYGEDAVAFHFTWNLDPDGVYAVLPVLEAALRAVRSPPALGQVLHVRVGTAGLGVPALRRLRGVARPARPGPEVRQRVPGPLLRVTGGLGWSLDHRGRSLRCSTIGVVHRGRSLRCSTMVERVGVV